MNNRMNFHSVPDWKTIDVTAIGRIPSHTPWYAYESEEAARTFSQEPSRYRRSLNGEYSFRLYACPEEAEDFFLPEYDASDWGTIPVPGSWELQPGGDPIYTNHVYPWSYDLQEDCMITPSKDSPGVPNPPYIPSQNPTGCYRFEFTVPEDFDGRDTYLHFDGVEAAFYVWVNGTPVGYSEDSKLPCEFRITDSVKPGRNLLALQVMKFASSTYLEDQDYWHLSGIHRSVWLLSKPALCIEDYKIIAEPDLYRGGGSVSVDISISRKPYFADYTVKAAIYDSNDVQIACSSATVWAQADYRTDNRPTANTGRVEFTLDTVSLWTTESPTLYTMTITLIDPNGTACDFEACRFGFKKLEVKHGVVYLNGTRLIIRGVNRHDHCLRTGRTVSREHMIEEIRQMKRMNINSVRTCHYPDNPMWYDLCDEYGILLICECNLETHGVMGALTHNPMYVTNFVERAMRMVTAYKNHVSIYSWSLGNESGTGANHAAMYGFIKEYDKTRLCQYEAGSPDRNISDVRGNMYAPIEQIMELLCDPEDERPIILVEYLYQIRNSGGGLHKFRSLIERFPRFQGGYIWDWQDKCLLAKTADGEEFFGYGGDFGESHVDPTSPNYMTNNGIVLADLTWKPVAYETKQAYCPVWVEEIIPRGFSQNGVRRDSYIIKNRSLCTLPGPYRLTAALRENGVVVCELPIALPDLAPMKDASITPVFPYEKKAGCEYFVEFTWNQIPERWYAEADYEVGFRQYSLPNRNLFGGAASDAVPDTGSNAAPASIRLTESDTEYQISARLLPSAASSERSCDSDAASSARSLQLAIRKSDGRITQLTVNGVPRLVSGPVICTERGLTGLDAEPTWGWHRSYRRFSGLTCTAGTPELLTAPAPASSAAFRCSDSAPSTAFHCSDPTSSATFHCSDPASVFCSHIRVTVPYTLTDADGTVPACGTIAYDITAAGIHVDFTFRTDPATYTALPRAGLEFILPAGFERLTYYGSGEIETYSDRMLAGRIQLCRSTVAEQHVPFSPTSETGGHEQTRFLTLANEQGETITVTGDRPFHFDVHHSSVEEYRAARHEHELVTHPEIWLHIDALHAPIGSDMAWSTVICEEERPKAELYQLGFHITF